MPDLTLPEKRMRLDLFREELGDATSGKCEMWRYDMQWLLDLAAAELSRQEREAEADLADRHNAMLCRACHHERENHDVFGCMWWATSTDQVFDCGCRLFVEPIDSPITDGEAG